MAIISGAQLTRMKTSIEGSRRRVARMREEADEKIQKVVRTVTIGGTAFAVGALEGRDADGKIELAGVPASLWLGVGLNLGGLLGFGGERTADHLSNFGDGALAAYLTRYGRTMGQQMKAKGGRVSGQALSEEELEDLAS